jgi:ubiquinone/menaquinone biosynthesis C-methylase UbiE
MTRWKPVPVITAALAAALSLSAAVVWPQHHPPGHGAHGDRYGNPADLDAYIARLMDPERDESQKPDQLVAALKLRPGQVACDVGAGPGYFTLRLARAVGTTGLVYAVDVEPRILEALRTRVEESGARNVVPVLGLGSDPLLPPAACDLVLVVNTYHHFPDRTAYLRRLTRSLKPRGRIVNVDYHKRETPHGPPLEHRISREDFLREAGAAGLALAAEHTFLPYQYALELRAR